MLVYAYTCIRIYAGVHVCLCVYIVECIHERGYVCVSSCVWLCVAAFQIRLVRPEPESDLCSLCTRYVGDSKTDPWDEP